jgi:hypothetical protein
MAHQSAEHERRKFMNSKLAPPPQVASETMQALLTAATGFAAAKPWEIMADCDLVGLTDPITGETRLACVLGNAGEVFGAVFYRRATGLRWILNALNGPETSLNADDFSTMDSLKVELLPRNQMLKEDLSVLKALNFKPAGRGLVWPQFQSAQPGWLPWFIDQQEAEQLLADLPRVNVFAALFRNHPDLFDNRVQNEIPFLPNPMPNRPIQIEDLEWRPLIPLPETFEPFKATGEQLEQLRSLKREPKAAFEYGSRLLLGSTVVEQGRPCYSRINLLVEHDNGFMLGFDLALATIPYVQCAGRGLVKALVSGGSLPGTILIDDIRLEPILGPLCDILNMDLLLSEELAGLAEAQNSLNNYLRTGPR